jgi:hypothetical protein
MFKSQYCLPQKNRRYLSQNIGKVRSLGEPIKQEVVKDVSRIVAARKLEKRNGIDGKSLEK